MFWSSRHDALVKECQSVRVAGRDTAFFSAHNGSVATYMKQLTGDITKGVMKCKTEYVDIQA